MFITFEGPEGSGKTTQLRLLADALEAAGRRVVCTREPGGTPIAERIRALALHETLAPEAELLLFLAARAEHVAVCIRPALEQGRVVLCDRFTDSTVAYQGYGLGLGLAELRRLCAFAAGDLTPDLTLLLDLDPELGLRRRFAAAADRASDPGSVNRMEQRHIEFHRRVRDGFLREAEHAPGRFCRIDAGRPAADVQAEIWRCVAVRVQSVHPMEGVQ